MRPGGTLVRRRCPSAVDDTRAAYLDRVVRKLGGRGLKVEVRGPTKVYLLASWMRFFPLTQIREPVRALDEVSIRFDGGQICRRRTGNGFGKTTLFKILTGLSPGRKVPVVAGIDDTESAAAAGGQPWPETTVRFGPALTCQQT
jgi:ABC-type glutathione transport system ATPase component